MLLLQWWKTCNIVYTVYIKLIQHQGRRSVVPTEDIIQTELIFCVSSVNIFEFRCCVVKSELQCLPLLKIGLRLSLWNVAVAVQCKCTIFCTTWWPCAPVLQCHEKPGLIHSTIRGSTGNLWVLNGMITSCMDSQLVSVIVKSQIFKKLFAY